MIFLVDKRHFGSVASWQIFRPQNTKVAQYKSQQPEKSASEFFADLSKNGQKWE
jgi:hypothetical protein